MWFTNFTCAYKTWAASMNEIIIVREDKGAALLNLQAVLATGDSIAAVYLGGLEVLRTQPGLINHLGGRQRDNMNTTQGLKENWQTGRQKGNSTSNLISEHTAS
ncbi:hypothetical protein AMECASPLE_030703 [Ameca splendens]|uniref:Uncharacterized protein n=1 Tax=Ameca splendens TaxID=208324 RepID=A0ABV0ZSC5_9TELE